MEYNRITVTSALPYANGPLHIGHLAGAYLSADIYVRFQRMMGKDIVFICGSDEHGAAITLRAAKENLSPQEIIDKYHDLFKIAFDKMGVSFDIYHRTSSELHHETAQEFFKNLYDNGEFVEHESDQYYDVEAHQFLADRFIVGTCPKCGNTEAYGDQCEKCGSTLNPTDLINPKSVLSGSTPELRKTSHWYLPLDKYSEWLETWISSGELDGQVQHYPEEWKSHVIGQCKSWIEGGLQPRSMTRDLDWGVDVPKSIPGSDGKKLYVWMDAPIGYISATKQWAIDNGKDWKDYWQKEDTKLIHFIGKDNIVFHCIIFPAILKAHGEYILPYNVPANQFMNLEGRKISTSKNWAVWVNEYVEQFPEKIDELRYSMIKNMPELKDSEFTWKGYQEAVNNELVNNLSNFINRVLVLNKKYFDGIVPEFDDSYDIHGPEPDDAYSYFENELMRLHDGLQELAEFIRQFDFRSALRVLMELSTAGNQILQNNAPWKMYKEDEEAVKPVINLCLQYVAALSLAMRPFLPFSSDKLQSILNLEPISENGEWDDMMYKLCENEVLLSPGHEIGESLHLFTRIDDEVIENQISQLEQSQKESENNTTNTSHKPLKNEITFDDFAKLDLRTGTIIEAEKVPKADKLLKLTVDLGFEKRTVVSGIAEHYDPENIIGNRVTLLANLAPRKLRGIESQGMILMADRADGKLAFLGVDTEWPDGETIG
ncbi:MAG TPA: methionine--tRNA ligase [Saprospiraceae bacterium]|nr:methionine--tRNA ligase [Saprospiraceae bacterium]